MTLTYRPAAALMLALLASTISVPAFAQHGGGPGGGGGFHGGGGPGGGFHGGGMG
ncbi:hypothetical protein JK213_14125, partial [Gluconobacter sp. Dm-44]|nr:hypothetical protein [Gluconobacter sp. Dm-44]